MPRATVGAYLGAASFHRGARVRDHLSVVAAAGGATRSQVDEVIDQFSLDPVLDRRAGTLSLGTRQRVCLAAAILGAPPVVLLDEPAGALDPGESRDLHRRLADLAVAGHTVIVSTHHLEPIAPFATHFVLLRGGSVLASGPLAESPYPDLSDLYERLVR